MPHYTLGESEPRSLVCHDSGVSVYVEDHHVLGQHLDLAYTFTYWQYVDTFVYFSHHRISVPPTSWIHAGHKHGVKVLGTVLLEWEVRCAS